MLSSIFAPQSDSSASLVPAWRLTPDWTNERSLVGGLAEDSSNSMLPQ